MYHVSTSRLHIYTKCPSLGFIHVLRDHHSAPCTCIYHVSTTRLHVYTTCSLLSFIYIPRVHHLAPCMYHVSTTRLHLYTRCPLLGFIYIPRVHNSAPYMYHVSNTQIRLLRPCVTIARQVATLRFSNKYMQFYIGKPSTKFKCNNANIQLGCGRTHKYMYIKEQTVNILKITVYTVSYSKAS